MTAHAESVVGSAAVEYLAPLPRQRIEQVSVTSAQRVYLRIRRFAEIVLAALGLAAASLPMLLIALGVRVTMGSPVLFEQDRVTRDGRVFRLRKFRSMKIVGEKGSMDDADRIVPFGTFLRSTSLDELPSLWNILRGEMSIVGPRPLPTDYRGRFSAEQFARHAVPAGLTGLAQVRGRNLLGWDDRFHADLEYVRQVGPLLDLRVVIATVLTVLRRDGVTDGGGVSMADFPGPQAISHVTLQGPSVEGAWECRDRSDRLIASGSMRILDATVATFTMRLGQQGSAAAPEQLDDAILLVLSRLRAEHSVQWARIDSVTEHSDELVAALHRAGFVYSRPGVRYPTRITPPPARGGEESTLMQAFIGLPDSESLP